MGVYDANGDASKPVSVAYCLKDKLRWAGYILNSLDSLITLSLVLCYNVVGQAIVKVAAVRLACVAIGVIKEALLPILYFHPDRPCSLFYLKAMLGSSAFLFCFASHV